MIGDEPGGGNGGSQCLLRSEVAPRVNGQIFGGCCVASL